MENTMAIETNEAGATGQSIPLDAQAQTLHAFVRKHDAHFTLEQAHAALLASSITEHEDPRSFARRLQHVLALNGTKIKYTAALHAAALLMKGQSWQKYRQGNLFHTLTLWTLNSSAEEGLASWADAGPRLARACEQWLQQQAMTKVLHIDCNPRAITLMGASGPDSQLFPFALLGPARADDPNWLNGASGALAYLRRHIEETRSGFIDGLATLQLCDQRAFERIGGPSITPADAPNSELILLRQDNPLDPGGYEIVRGDELTCFGQLEAATEGESRTATISVDDDGGWNCGKARFAWQLATLKPREFVPGLVMQGLGPRDTSRLLHRYRVAKRVLDKTLPARTVLKRLSYLGVPADTYRIDLHKLLLAMSRAGLSWEQFCDDSGEAGRELTPELPTGLTLSILSRIKLEDPNTVFSRPSRSELALAQDDSVMRALMPRVNHVRYRISCDLPADEKEAISDAIGELSTSILLRRGAIPMEEPLPDFVYSSDCEELRLKLKELGLLVYVGVMPHLMRVPETAEMPAESWPFAFGHSLFLDIDRPTQ
jgi:hypothetical protein